jgi:hypothetical protein
MLYQDYTCDVDFDGALLRFRIPQGYVWDGASVPRFAWSITGMRPEGLMEAGACIHDWIYDKGGKLPLASCPAKPTWTRKEADRIFLKINQLVGIPPRRCKLAYGIVRAFGGLFWGKPGPTLPTLR